MPGIKLAPTLAQSQLGHRDEASKRYDKAVAWMDKNQPQDRELRRFRAEAAELLGIKEQPAPKPELLPPPKLSDE